MNKIKKNENKYSWKICSGRFAPVKEKKKVKITMTIHVLRKSNVSALSLDCLSAAVVKEEPPSYHRWWIIKPGSDQQNRCSVVRTVQWFPKPRLWQGLCVGGFWVGRLKYCKSVIIAVGKMLHLDLLQNPWPSLKAGPNTSIVLITLSGY